MKLPTFIEFTEPVPSLDIRTGDRVWVTEYSAVLVRSLTESELYPHLHLTTPIQLGTGDTREVAP